MDIKLKTYKTLRTESMHMMMKDLVALRKKRGLTQEELNFILGVADYLLAKWEVGIRNPTCLNLFCWAEALNADLVVVARDGTLLEQQSANDNTLKALK